MQQPRPRPTLRPAALRPATLRAGRRHITHPLIALALGLFVACSPALPDELFAQEDIAGLPVTDFDSGPRADAPAPQIDVDGVTDVEVDTLASAASEDLTEYWTEVYPEHFDGQFEPVARLLSYDSANTDAKACGPLEGLVNAFYCIPEDTIGWDRGTLLPLLKEQFGSMGIATVMAHEYGHAVQHRLGEQAGVTPATPTIVTELQADCFAGNYVRWMAEGNSPHFEVSTVDGLNDVLTGLHFVRDVPGGLRQDVTAHGTALDRIFAFQEGFTGDPEDCAAIDEGTAEEVTTQQLFSEQDTDQGEVPIDEQTLALAQESLDAAFADYGADRPDIVAGDARCPDGSATPPATYCAGNNTVTVDLDGLREMATPLDMEAERRGEPVEGFGDFGAFGSVASRYALALQRADGEPVDEPQAGIRSACHVGAWAAFANKPREGEGPILRLSPGDLDEAVLEMLRPDSLISSDVDGEPVPGGFDRVAALRTGFDEGVEACQ